MGKKLGHEYKMFVDNGSGVFNPVLGEVSHNREAATGFVDTSSKGSGQFATKKPLRKDLTITVEGKKDLPDPGGLERVYALQKVYPQVAANWQMRRDPFTGSDIVFAASMNIGNFNDPHPDQENATFSFQLTCDTAPTVDLVG
jgi:hypothetical protein